jgi:hypothetical protein
MGDLPDLPPDDRTVMHLATDASTGIDDDGTARAGETLNHN